MDDVDGDANMKCRCRITFKMCYECDAYYLCHITIESRFPIGKRNVGLQQSVMEKASLNVCQNSYRPGQIFASFMFLPMLSYFLTGFNLVSLMGAICNCKL